ncbi:Uncharacterised protein [Amycolatopsis camponoti]|uniref:Uncharacterized protein n=1 Tax=Amycolatopsis camponoti TaxID=2606593 RepID=A0A6I8LR70_9PSEU|nr:Uncharacterised protein [Amycolatopsis camponoti]
MRRTKTALVAALPSAPSAFDLTGTAVRPPTPADPRETSEILP